MLSDEAFAELRAKFKQALPDIIAGNDWMAPLTSEASKQRDLDGAVVAEIVSVTAREMNVNEQALRGKVRTVRVARAKHMVAYIASEIYKGQNTTELARILRRDRTTVQNSLNRAEDMLYGDNWFHAAYKRIWAQLS